MKPVTISSKFQVVTPLDVRENLRLYPGQKMQIIPYEDHMVMILEQKIADMRGFLKGMDTGFVRE